MPTAFSNVEEAGDLSRGIPGSTVAGGVNSQEPRQQSLLSAEVRVGLYRSQGGIA